MDRAVSKPVPVPVPHHPPNAILAQQNLSGIAGFSSLGSMSLSHRNDTVVDAGDDLFAIALSPRSPDLPRSPFSFAPHETMPRMAAAGGNAA